MPHCTTLHIHGTRITYDNARQLLRINGRELHLRPQTYAVARDLIIQYAAYEARQVEEPLVSLDALCRAAGVDLHQLKHPVSEARSLLRLLLELDTKSVRGEGYFLKPIKGS